MANPEEVKVLRTYLKMKLTRDLTWSEPVGVRKRVLELMRRTAEAGEAHSALLIGPPGSGKTTLISSVLAELKTSSLFQDNVVVVKLSGLLHQDDKLALQAITTQMELENLVGDRVFGTVAENLSFLLSCILSGESRRCRSMLFILEEFQQFCHAGVAQTLLYNLFDITHGGRAPLCVIGITSRLDVMELLEKRVKSRFSHRLVFLFPGEREEGAPARSPCERLVDRFVQRLRLPETAREGEMTGKRKRVVSERGAAGSVSTAAVCREWFGPSRKHDALYKQFCERYERLDRQFVSSWNAHVKSLSEDPEVVDAIERFSYYSVNEQLFGNALFRLVSRLGGDRLTTKDIVAALHVTVTPELRTKRLQSLSVLEFSLLITMTHGMDALGDEPMNFEMVWHRYTKFARDHTSAPVSRQTALKAWQHLRALELAAEARGTRAAGAPPAEYRLRAPAVSRRDVLDAAAGYRALPTELRHWLDG